MEDTNIKDQYREIRKIKENEKNLDILYNTLYDMDQTAEKIKKFIENFDNNININISNYNISSKLNNIKEQMKEIKEQIKIKREDFEKKYNDYDRYNRHEELYSNLKDLYYDYKEKWEKNGKIFKISSDENKLNEISVIYGFSSNSCNPPFKQLTGWPDRWSWASVNEKRCNFFYRQPIEEQDPDVIIETLQDLPLPPKYPEFDAKHDTFWYPRFKVTIETESEMARRRKLYEQKITLVENMKKADFFDTRLKTYLQATGQDMKNIEGIYRNPTTTSVIKSDDNYREQVANNLTNYIEKTANIGNRLVDTTVGGTDKLQEGLRKRGIIDMGEIIQNDGTINRSGMYRRTNLSPRAASLLETFKMLNGFGSEAHNADYYVRKSMDDVSMDRIVPRPALSQFSSKKKKSIKKNKKSIKKSIKK